MVVNLASAFRQAGRWPVRGRKSPSLPTSPSRERFADLHLQGQYLRRGPQLKGHPLERGVRFQPFLALGEAVSCGEVERVVCCHRVRFTLSATVRKPSCSCASSRPLEASFERGLPVICRDRTSHVLFSK